MATSRNLRRRTPRRPAESLNDLCDYAKLSATRQSCARSSAPPDGVQRSAAFPWPIGGQPPKDDLSSWTVTDDWPRPVPVTQAEVDVFEAWFGDVFDELFGPCQ